MIVSVSEPNKHTNNFKSETVIVPCGICMYRAIGSGTVSNRVTNVAPLPQLIPTNYGI